MYILAAKVEMGLELRKRKLREKRHIVGKSRLVKELEEENEGINAEWNRKDCGYHDAIYLTKQQRKAIKGETDHSLFKR